MAVVYHALYMCVRMTSELSSTDFLFIRNIFADRIKQTNASAAGLFIKFIIAAGFCYTTSILMSERMPKLCLDFYIID